MNLQLSIGFASNPRTWPILDGRARVDGVDLVPSIVAASELFWRQLRFADFDVSEMSVSSFMIARAQGDDRWVGLPIFTTKHFFHTELLVRKDAGIDVPADLKGKRVGVLEYQQTAALWVRGALEHEFGVRAQDMEFWMERTPDSPQPRPYLTGPVSHRPTRPQRQLSRRSCSGGRVAQARRARNKMIGTARKQPSLDTRGAATRSAPLII